MTNNTKTFSNVLIKGMGTYLSATKVDNDFYIKHFKKLGVENIEHILEVLGRKTRYISTDINETTITMGVNAALKAIDNANIKVDELDMVVFASNTPEYFSPSNALLITELIGAKNAKIVYDLNCDCAGLTVALDNVSRMLKTNKRYKKALVIGSVLMNSYSRQDDVMGYATFSDCASAVILESVDENIERGFIDSIYFTDTIETKFGRNPKIGFSKYFRSDIVDKEELKFFANPVGESPYPSTWKKLTLDICKDNDLRVEDISHYLLPQLTRVMCNNFLQLMDIKGDESKFLSEELGYLGVNSEIFQLVDAMDRQVISTGSNVLMSGSGLGYTTLMVLYRL